MSFGIKNLLTCNKTVGGWYYLLTETVGQKKHLQVSSSKEGILQDKSNIMIPAVNKDLQSMESITIVVKRGRNGYGFSLTGSSPAQICRVEEGSHGEHAGLRRNDNIVKINGQNVSRSTADSVARIVRQSQKQIILDVQRPREVETLEPCSRKPVQGEVIREQASLHGILSAEEQCKENGVDVGRRRQMRGTTVAKPQVSLTYQDLTAHERNRQSAIQELLHCEEEYVRMMQFGIQHYSRPLRHHILTSQEHALLFQNLEKLTALSEFHASQLRENSLSYCDIDLPENKFVDTVGSVYQPKVSFHCEAYETYCSGLRRAERILNRFKSSKQFQKFLEDVSVESWQPDISAFISQPSEHLRRILVHLQAILTNTNREHHDYQDLSHVVNVIQHSCNKINEITLHTSATSVLQGNTSHNQQAKSVTSSSSYHSQSSFNSSAANITVSVDSEVLDLQRRLLFARNVQAFQLATASRHVIYSGELLQVEGRKWAKLWAILFNDLLLLTKVETDGYVTVLEEPMYLKTVTSTEFDCEHPSEFVIGIETSTTDEMKASYDLRRVTLRAPTIEQKFVWKSIIEHRILAGKAGRESILLPLKVGELVENFGVL